MQRGRTPITWRAGFFFKRAVFRETSPFVINGAMPETPGWGWETIHNMQYYLCRTHSHPSRTHTLSLSLSRTRTHHLSLSLSLSLSHTHTPTHSRTHPPTARSLPAYSFTSAIVIQRRAGRMPTGIAPSGTPSLTTGCAYCRLLRRQSR